MAVVEPSPDWTVESLRVYLLAMISSGVESHRREIELALDALLKRIDVLDRESEHVRDELHAAFANHRVVTDGLKDQLGMRVTRDEYNSAHSELMHRVEAVGRRIDDHLAQSTGQQVTQTESRTALRNYLLILVGVSTVILALLQLVINHV